MKKFMTLFTVSLLVIIILNANTQTDPENPIRIQKLSDRVLVFTQDSPMENIVVALVSKKGLVVVDATGSPYTAALMRKDIEKEFGRNDFAYVINTHHHWDHAWGNQTFSEAVFMGHENCVAQLQPGAVDVSGMVARSKQNLDDLKPRLATLDPDSEETKNLRHRIAYDERRII